MSYVAIGMAPRGNEDKQQRPRVGAGLKNMGNTCFLNAVLQCLTYIPCLANYLLSREHSQCCVKPGSCVMCRVQEHVHKVLHATESALVPVDVITVLPEIGERFRLGMQEDAHEFLRCTLEAMQRACLGEGSLDTSSEQTIIHQIFGSFLRSRVWCSGCQVVSDAYEPFLDILLDIKAAASLSEALEKFVKPELLDARSGFRCRHCGQMTAASKRLTIHWAPEVLTVGLKRFEDVSGGKISKVVTYPKVLDLGPYMTAGEAQRYSLYAVLVHKGESCHSGHYFCYIKANDGLWYKMDDSSVTPCDIDTALQQEAYLLFYVRSSDLRTGARASSSSAPSRTSSSHGQRVAGSQQDPVVRKKESPRDGTSSRQALSTSHGSHLGRVSARSRSRQRVQQGRASVPATISQRAQRGRSPVPATVSQGIQQSRVSAPGTTGQKLQESGPFGQWRPVQQFLQRGSFRAAAIAQQPQRSRFFGPARTGQQSWPGAWGAPLRQPRSSWPGRLSKASSLSRREHDGLVHTEPPHPVLDTWQGDKSRGWTSFVPSGRFQRQSGGCFMCRRERQWLLHIEPHHHVLHARHRDRSRGWHNFGPSASFQDSSARERFRSRSPLWGTDFHPLSPHRVSTPRDKAAPRDQGAPVPVNISSSSAPPPKAAQEKASPPRKRERSRSLQRGPDRQSPSVGFRDSARKRRRKSSAKRKKRGKRPKGQRR
ncbi:uncharacterized protein LRP34_005503 [Phaethornis superciliosus]